MPLLFSSVSFLRVFPMNLFSLASLVRLTCSFVSAHHLLNFPIIRFLLFPHLLFSPRLLFLFILSSGWIRAFNGMHSLSTNTFAFRNRSFQLSVRHSTAREQCLHYVLSFSWALKSDCSPAKALSFNPQHIFPNLIITYLIRGEHYRPIMKPLYKD